MRRQRLSCMLLTLGLVFVLSSTASAATTLGSTTPPTGSSPQTCSSSVAFAQSSSDPSTPYTVPAGGGAITRWSTNTSGATAGTPVYLVVVRPQGFGYTVIGVDPEQVPTPVPTTATFTLSSPIAVQGGDTLALYSPASSGFTCFFSGGSTPVSDAITVLAGPGPSPLSGPPSQGQTLQTVGGTSGQLNVSAVVAPVVMDAAVSASSAPARPAVGNPALLQSTIVNHGPDSRPITFNDTVPAGLTVNWASAANGSCLVVGQQVTCAVNALPAGATAAVNILVTPSHAGTYMNNVNVSGASGATDPNLANNTASATLNVARKPQAAICTVPKLRGTPGGVAKRLLKLLGCRVRVKRNHGRGVPHGAVLKTKPKPGTYALGRKVTLIIRK